MTIVPSNVWGGVNSTDALGILNHFVQSSLLTGMKLAAADVNYSHSVNATDAFFVMSRYSAVITSFPAGDYLYHTDTVIVNGNQVTNNFDMLCFGDVNASYLLPKKDGSTVSLAYNGYLPVPSFTEFNLPVRIRTGAEIGAISLGFYYPEDYLEIIGAETVSQNPDVIFSAGNGLFKMGWASLNPMVAGDGETIVILKLRSKDLTDLQGTIALDLYQSSELADSKANVIDGVYLEIPEIQTTSQGIDDLVTVSGISVYPNPMTDKTTIEFELLKESRVKLTVYDVTGNLVTTLTEAVYPSGNHQLRLDSGTLTAGIYMLKMEIASKDQIVGKTIKVVVSK
jgi:hypothetical protein